MGKLEKRRPAPEPIEPQHEAAADELDQAKFTDTSWAVYQTAFSQFSVGLPPKIQITEDEEKQYGRQAVDAAFDDAIQRKWLPATAKKPEVEIIRPAPPQPQRTPGQERQHRRTVRNRLIALAAAATLSVTMGAAAGAARKYNETYDAVTTDRPVPTSTGLAELRVKTEAACAGYEKLNKFKPPAGVSELGGYKYEVSQDVDKVIVTGDYTSLTVPKDRKVNELFLCAWRGKLQVLGEVATLGINSTYSDTQIIGDVGRAYLANDVDSKSFTDADDNTADVHGHVGDFMVRGNDRSRHNGRYEDVLVWGRVDNALETDEGHVMLWEFDTRGQGTIGRYQVV